MLYQEKNCSKFDPSSSAAQGVPADEYAQVTVVAGLHPAHLRIAHALRLRLGGRECQPLGQQSRDGQRYCGLPSSPCRSISQAIANASAGDTIWVGAGHYGNVNGDAGFTDPGDEQPAPMPLPLETGYQGCIVCVNKAVKIYSLDGAPATIIDSSPTPAMFNVTVALLADGAVFGVPGHGFTITGGNGTGVVVDMQTWNESRVGVTISGNVDLNDASGFAVFGPDGYLPLPGSCPPNIPQACPGYAGTVLLEGNEADNNNGTAFFIEPRHVSPPTKGSLIQFIVTGNVARGAGTGFDVEPGVVECDDCFDDGPAYVVSTQHNFATNGGVGFSFRNAGLARDNLASDNSQYGFLVVNSGPFLRNTAIGNAGPGVIVGLESTSFDNAPPPSFILPFEQSNFFSNDRNRPALSLGGYPTPYNYNPGPSAHCGVLDMGAIWEVYSGVGFGPPSTPQSVTLQATGNYRGSTSGPSSSGPGDTAGGACDQNNATTITKPSATAEITVTPLP
jgi:hypothetical protein